MPDDWLEKMRSIGGVVKGGTPKFHGNNVADLYAESSDKDVSAIANMAKDRIMVRHIKEGKGSDKGLKREAELLQKRESKIRKDNSRKPRLDRIKAKKERYKQRYKCEAA